MIIGKWNLRAAYFAQELLQTFSDKLGEVSLIPVTGGIFEIHLYHKTTSGEGTEVNIKDELIWERKRDGGFPETKELKNRVRNIIDPDQDMGHVDRALKKSKAEEGKVNQVEGIKQNDQNGVNLGHDVHKARGLPPADCEECREAATIDGQTSNTK